MGDTAADMQKLFGRCILFVGVEAQHWTVGTFAGAAKLARELGVDTISPKRADGSIKWYDTPEQLAAERKACLDEGVGYAPFLYSYGPKFGENQVRQECEVLAEMMKANDGSVICDMETEWDGAVSLAAVFCELMRPVPGVLGITTWADPVDQDWLGVMAELAPCCNLWIPQRYDNWLAAQGLPVEATIIQPGVDLSSEFGANNVLAICKAIAERGQSAWVWEYSFAYAHQAVMRAVSATLHGTATAELLADMVAPSPAPEPAPAEGPEVPASVVQGQIWASSGVYVTTDTDASLADISARLGLSNWYQDLYKPNMTIIEQAVRTAGHPAGSNGGLLIVPGIPLRYGY